MPDLAYRQQKIQEKRKQTPFREFLLTIGSRQPMNFYKNQGYISRYPDTERTGRLIAPTEEIETMQFALEPSWNFFADITTLRNNVPLPSLIHNGIVENSAYADSAVDTKNTYLTVGSYTETENVLYSFDVRHSSRNIYNALCIGNSENVYFALSVFESFNIFFSKSINNSNNIRYSVGMNGCSECIECSNLENKSYCIRNQQLDKAEYLVRKQKILNEKKQFYQTNYEYLSGKFLERGNHNVKGTAVFSSENVENGIFIYNLKSAKNVVLVGTKYETSENYYDVFIGGRLDNFYAIVNSWWPASHYYCSTNLAFSNTMFYSFSCEACSFCLGCIGLKNKSFCILNKQYTKEERHSKVDEIFTQMEKDWTLWEFFPATMNPFYFNDTAAYLIDPTFTKEEVEKAGYLRRDEPIKVDIPEDAELVKVSDLDQYEGYDENGKRHIDEEILKKVIIDDQGNVRRIVNMEYVFLMKHALPLPRKHRLERMKENFRIG